MDLSRIDGSGMVLDREYLEDLIRRGELRIVRAGSTSVAPRTQTLQMKADKDHYWTSIVVHILELVNAATIYVVSTESRQALHAKLAPRHRRKIHIAISRVELDALLHDLFSLLSRLEQIQRSPENYESVSVKFGELDAVRKLVALANAHWPDVETNAARVERAFLRLFMSFRSADDDISECFSQQMMAFGGGGLAAFGGESTYLDPDQNIRSMYGRFSAFLRLSAMCNSFVSKIWFFRIERLFYGVFQKTLALTEILTCRSDTELEWSRIAQLMPKVEQVVVDKIHAFDALEREQISDYKSALKRIDLDRCTYIGNQPGDVDIRQRMLALSYPICEDLCVHMEGLKEHYASRSGDLQAIRQYLYLLLPFAMQYDGACEMEAVRPAFDRFVEQHRANPKEALRPLFALMIKINDQKIGALRCDIYKAIDGLREYDDSYAWLYGAFEHARIYWRYSEAAYSETCEYHRELQEKAQADQKLQEEAARSRIAAQRARDKERVRQTRLAEQTDASEEPIDDTDPVPEFDKEVVQAPEESAASCTTIEEDSIDALPEAPRSIRHVAKGIERGWLRAARRCQDGLTNAFARQAYDNAMAHIADLLAITARLEYVDSRVQKAEHIHSLLVTLSIAVEQLVSAAVLERHQPREQHQVHALVRHDFVAMLRTLDVDATTLEMAQKLVGLSALEQKARSLSMNRANIPKRQRDAVTLLNDAAQLMIRKPKRGVDPTKKLADAYGMLWPSLQQACSLFARVTGVNLPDLYSDADVTMWETALSSQLSAAAPGAHSVHSSHGDFGARIAVLLKKIPTADYTADHTMSPAQQDCARDARSHLVRLRACMETMDAAVSPKIAVQWLHRYVVQSLFHTCLFLAARKGEVNLATLKFKDMPKTLWHWLGLLGVSSERLSPGEQLLCDRSPHILNVTRYARSYSVRHSVDHATRQFLQMVGVANRTPATWEMPVASEVSATSTDSEWRRVQSSTERERQAVVEDAFASVDAGLKLLERILGFSKH